MNLVSIPLKQGVYFYFNEYNAIEALGLSQSL
ncbi:Uncharacterised protein [Phocoenobacter uteri]|uniref:Uncharacterized protein n=1 Tax=Phocoenobacter uteri TaxID=146806 RepID=A0A379C7W5_9PAST|nr:Uncharacterised protein [Phocoenobacter uteri]